MAPQINDTSFNPVSLSSSSLSFSVLPFGLTFYSFQLRQNGNETELLIGPQKPEEHAQQSYKSSETGEPFLRQLVVTGANYLVVATERSSYPNLKPLKTSTTSLLCSARSREPSPKQTYVDKKVPKVEKSIDPCEKEGTDD
ncbi:hypothetical protein BT69DRAFT_1357080 [Atractiella rhizophila]|nr:hypothetical protein BT69DRAFT_1357080 [Atractiella rhizophila]